MTAAPHDPSQHLASQVDAAVQGPWRFAAWAVLACAAAGGAWGWSLWRDMQTAPRATPEAVTGDRFVPIRWSELVPAGWTPSRELAALQLAQRGVPDADPVAREALRAWRAHLDDAPVNRALDGRMVRLVGHVVPLETQAGGWSEFLLVPYFGACIHTPPPPANQVVHVVADPPLAGLRTMDAVEVRGVLSTARHNAAAGTSGYRLVAAGTRPHDPPRRP